MSVSDPVAVETLRDTIKGMQFVTMTTKGLDGVPRSRGMAVRVADFDGDLWFMTLVDGQLLAEVDAMPTSAVLFADGHAQRYVAATGTATIVMDPADSVRRPEAQGDASAEARKSELRIALVRLAVERAHYWEVSSAPRLVEFMKGPTRTTVARPRDYTQLVTM